MTSKPAAGGKARFTFQDWPVYVLALELVDGCLDLSKVLLKDMGRDLADQLRRATTSIPLNIAEGYGRWTKKDKLYFNRVALGSLFEVVAVLDILKKRKLLECERYVKLISMSAEIGKMLRGMCRFLEEGRNEEGEI